jgi:predicted dehydrogenase
VFPASFAAPFRPHARTPPPTPTAFFPEFVAMSYRTLSALVTFAVVSIGSVAAAAEPLKVGIIGLDTSHVKVFTSLFHKAKDDSPLAGVRVVAAYPAGSQDVVASHTRLKEYTDFMKTEGVEIVDSVEALLPKVDAILLESVDGRPHLAQAKPIFAANKSAKIKMPVFIDKPIAASLKDTLEIFRLAEESGTPVFSTSSLRYYTDIASVHDKEQRFGDVIGCISYGPCSLEEHHPDLFWYGIHGVEVLFTIMGPGCESVSCIATEDTHVATGVWSDGRIATFRGIRTGKISSGAVVFGTKTSGSTIDEKHPRVTSYEPMLVEIVKFFRGGEPPVAAATTTNLVAFMEAASESLRQGGKSVKIADVMKQAAATKTGGK